MKLHILYLAFSSTLIMATAAATDTIHITADGAWVEFLSEKTLENDTFTLTIASPDGQIWSEVLAGKEIPLVNLEAIFGDRLMDGQYNYEILPHIDQTRLPIAPELRGLESYALSVASAQVGTFTVIGNQVLNPNQHELPPAVSTPSKFSQSDSTTSGDNDGGTRDFVINDDLIVTGSTCIGFDCVNGETFSFDTLKLKENNTRMTFIDTSTVSGFPAGSWQLRANDSASGGADHFSVDWLGTSANVGTSPLSTPFRVDGSAPTNSIRVSSAGRVGLRTSTPVLDLHIATGNTPGLRLEQNNSGGWTPQSWDIAGNEANFFVRDVTSGSRLPFRIRPGAPTSSIDIASNGNVGIGNSSPSSPLHVRRTNNAAEIRIEDTGAGDLNMLSLLNNGHPIFVLQDTSQSDVRWQFRTAGTQGSNERFQINKLGSGVIEMQLLAGGNVTIAGTLTQGSSREIKENFAPLESGDILTNIQKLELLEWSYKSTPDKRHFGPMAEDFHAAFGFGTSDKHIAPGDLAGIALAAAKALQAENSELRNRLERLEAELGIGR